MKDPNCIKCGEEYNRRRAQLGYATCLSCGDIAASAESARRAKCVAPAFNKGAYQYVGSLEDAKNVGR